jgi:ATPase subunit of ABC transporter with duplicated ATPase domains
MNEYYKQRYREETDYQEENKYRQGIAIAILELAEEGKKVSEILERLGISNKQYSSYIKLLSDGERCKLHKLVVRNAHLPKPRVLSKEEFIEIMLAK